jgi:hypothetical protein
LLLDLSNKHSSFPIYILTQRIFGELENSNLSQIINDDFRIINNKFVFKGERLRVECKKKVAGNTKIQQQR